LNTTEGRNTLSEAETRLGTCGDISLKFYVLSNMAVWLLEIGELPKALSAFENVRKVVHGIRARKLRTMLQLNLGELGLLSFDFQSARSSYLKAHNTLTPVSPYFYKMLISAGLGLCAIHDGDLGEARRRETELPNQPAFWTFDPTIVTVFRVRMLLKRRDLEGAVDLLETVRRAVRKRFVPAWMRLTLEECRILKRSDPKKAELLAEEGFELAARLELLERSRQFRRANLTATG
jgi:hypothetical protein